MPGTYNENQPRDSHGRWGTADNVKAEQVGTHAAGIVHNIPHGSGRLHLGGLAAALLGIAAGAAGEAIKPTLRGRHGR